MKLKSKSKNVIITGANGDIGINIVKNFINSGHRVVAISKNINNLLTINNRNYLFPIKLDLTNKYSYNKILQFLFKNNFKYIDILINNAAICISKLFNQLTIQDFKKIYEINFFAAVQMIQITNKLMKKKGHIINISSMGGIQGSLKMKGLSAYSSSKSALCTLTEVLYEEFKYKNLYINTLALGSVETNMFKKNFPKLSASMLSTDIGKYIYQFAITGNKFFNGKIIPVSLQNP